GLDVDVDADGGVGRGARADEVEVVDGDAGGVADVQAPRVAALDGGACAGRGAAGAVDAEGDRGGLSPRFPGGELERAAEALPDREQHRIPGLELLAVDAVDGLPGGGHGVAAGGVAAGAAHVVRREQLP